MEYPRDGVYGVDFDVAPRSVVVGTGTVRHVVHPRGCVDIVVVKRAREWVVVVEFVMDGTTHRSFCFCSRRIRREVVILVKF